MGYKSENKDNKFDKDWITFPDEPDAIDTEESDIWHNENDGRAEDLLKLSRLEAVVMRLNMHVNKELTRREEINKKPVPLWIRVLFHTPKNNKDVIIYHIVFGSLMLFAILLFAWAMGMVA